MTLSILNQLFTECWWWLFLWMLLAFLLGWLLRKWLSNESENCCSEFNDYKKRYYELEKKYNDLLKKESNQLENISNLDNTQNKFVNTKTESIRKTEKANISSPYDKLKEDNLQIIEGIGPKMESILKKNKINTWADLGSKTSSELRQILDQENPTRYRIIDPSTWAEQAQLASKRKWQELIKLQKKLDTGKKTAIGLTDSKLEKIMIKLGLIKKWKKDDLKAIEGIGPKIARLLNEAGIKTWKTLSETDPKTLKEILENGGKRFQLADPNTWPKQAKLADEGQWEELEVYQDALDGGK